MSVIGFSKSVKRGMSGKNDGTDFSYIHEEERETKPYRPNKKHKTNRKTFSREHKYFSGQFDDE